MKVFEIKIKNEYIKKILKSKNDLAIIITLDIIETNNYKKSSEIKNALSNLREYLKEQDIDVYEKEGKKGEKFALDKILAIGL